MHLYNNYDKSDFFCPVIFYYWVAQLLCSIDKCQQNRVNSTAWNSLPNMFSINNFRLLIDFIAWNCLACPFHSQLVKTRGLDIMDVLC